MKKNILYQSAQKACPDRAHFAWCALVALRTVQQDGQALSPLSTHVFLLRWLTVAYKQKRFSRSVAPDIENLLVQGRQQGLAANLFEHLDSMWTSSLETTVVPSDLRRLTYVIEQLKLQYWLNAAVSEEEWNNEVILIEEYSGTDALIVRKSALGHGFSEEGTLIAPLEFLVIGNLLACVKVFHAHTLQVVVTTSNRITLHPVQEKK